MELILGLMFITYIMVLVLIGQVNLIPVSSTNNRVKDIIEGGICAFALGLISIFIDYSIPLIIWTIFIIIFTVVVAAKAEQIKYILFYFVGFIPAAILVLSTIAIVLQNPISIYLLLFFVYGCFILFYNKIDQDY